MTCSLDEPGLRVQDQPDARPPEPSENVGAVRERRPAPADRIHVDGGVALCGW
jgi:hypothetical protein